MNLTYEMILIKRQYLVIVTSIKQSYKGVNFNPSSPEVRH